MREGKLLLILATIITMIAFAANSLLCRMALKETGIDAASFTTVRLLAGAAMLWLLMRVQRQAPLQHGSWRSALALFIYAVTLSYAYRSINTGAGALMLFGAVQATMLLAGFLAGERLRGWQTVGFVAAVSGLLVLVLPGVEAPALGDALLMLASGVAWGVYSLWGRGQPQPAAATAGNFLRAVPFTLALSLLALPWMQLDTRGLAYAALSGAVTSALGYVLWYRVLQHMRAMTASTVQLSAPVLAALGGIAFLGEALTRDLLIASVLIIGGIWLVLQRR
ncbi:MAG: DMT family transporter [Pseudomonadota bacterium]